MQGDHVVAWFEDFSMTSVQPLSMTWHQLSTADSLPRSCAALVNTLTVN